MSRSIGSDERDPTDALSGIREALTRRRDEQEALTARLELIGHQIAALEEAEAILTEDQSETRHLAAPHRSESELERPPADAGSPTEPGDSARGEAESQISKVQALLAEHPDRTWRAQEVADAIGAPCTKAQIDTVRTNLHRLARRGHVSSVGRGEFRWGGA
jgi:hypothetical protein